MTTSTTTPVTHKCGHTGNANVTGKRAFEIEGFVKWLAAKPCRDCDPKAKAKREAWVANRREEELAQARSNENKFGMEALSGPPKVVDWATRVRVDLVSAAWESLGLNEDEFAKAVGGPAAEVNAAGWWLDRREIDPASLPDHLAEALEQPVDGALENPF